jgi:hypothetical protein
VRLLAAVLGFSAAPSILVLLHLWFQTAPSPHHSVVVERPLVAIVGGRAEHCLPPEWPGVRPERVVNLARRDTDWRAVLAQIDFALQTAPPGILVLAVDPEQLLFDRATRAGHRADPDRTRRVGFATGGPAARLYGLIDRFSSVPRLLEEQVFTGRPHVDARSWGAAQGTHWADPDGLIGIRRAVAHARHEGIEVVPLLLPLPKAAIDAWTRAERGGELGHIRETLAALGARDHLEPSATAYFPDGVGCARQTGRDLLDL